MTTPTGVGETAGDAVAPPAPPPKPRSEWGSRRTLGVFLIVGMMAVIVVGIVWVIPPLLAQRPEGQSIPPEVALTLWLVIGAAILLLMIMAVALMSNFVIGSRDTPGPLGLPNGSVSAIIALLLLLIFSISSVYLYNQTRAGEGVGYDSTGVTAQMLAAIPQGRILAMHVENPAAEPAARTYAVTMAAAHPDSLDLARNISLTVGTLLSAVAGFYFGQRATQTGARSAHEVAAKARKPLVGGDLASQDGSKPGRKVAG